MCTLKQDEYRWVCLRVRYPVSFQWIKTSSSHIFPIYINGHGGIHHFQSQIMIICLVRLGCSVFALQRQFKDFRGRPSAADCQVLKVDEFPQFMVTIGHGSMGKILLSKNQGMERFPFLRQPGRNAEAEHHDSSGRWSTQC